MAQSQLQVTFEVAFDIDTVYNLDLFQKGWYKIKISPANERCWECMRLPNGAWEKTAEFTPCYIRYRREERVIAENWLFRIHRLIPSRSITDDHPLEVECEFNVELWFGEDDGEEEAVSTRKIHMQLKPTVHDVCTVTFDYGFMLSTRLSVHGAITIINQPYSRELITDDESNKLERVLLDGAAIEGIDMSDEMIRSYICTAHLRIIRQLNCTIRALREAARVATRYGTAKPPPVCHENEDTPKYVNNVMTKSKRADILSQTQVNIAQSSSKVLTTWNDFLDRYLKDKKWKRVLCVENRGAKIERLLSGCVTNMNPSKLSNSRYSLDKYDDLKDKILASKFWMYLPRPPILVQETDGYSTDLPIIYRDCYEKNSSVSTTPISIEDLVIGDTVVDSSLINCEVVDEFILDRRNPNDVDYEKEDLRIAHLSTFHPRNQAFLAQRTKSMSSLNIQGDFIRPIISALAAKQLHLIIMVHGLEGNSNDLRLWKTTLEQLYPLSHFEFLLCQSNHNLTHESIEEQGKRITEEVAEFLLAKEILPQRVSWVGHSMGALLVRLAANAQKLEPFQPLFEDFVSLCGPHTGLFYVDSAVVGAGLWLYEKWKKASSLKQLALRDSSQVSDTVIFKMATESPLNVFKRVLLVSAAGDRYVSPHSARIESPRQAFSDRVNGQSNIELVERLQRNLEHSKTIVERYHVVHQNLPQDTATRVIGRAAHIAVLDSQVFISAFLVASRAFSSS